MKLNVLLVTLSAAALASCAASDGTSGSPSTIGLTATNYVTITQTPTTIPTSSSIGVAPGTVHPEEGSYTLTDSPDDRYPSRVALRFKVPLPDLLNINSLSLDSNNQVPNWPPSGTTIRIPPNWTEPGAVPDTTAGGSGTGDTTPTQTTTTLAGGQSTCAPGEYTIQKDDTSKIKVANKLDTTVAALDAANANTPGYSGFYPGLKIKTPPKAEC